jgi:hypothetical protein
MTDKIKTILMIVDRVGAVFPLVEGGKKPAVAKGVHAASKNPALIKKHFREHPEHNCAIATGKVSGIVVLDVDGPEGRASLKALTESHGQLPKTVIVETPNGRHYYFQAPGYCVPNSGSNLTAISYRQRDLLVKLLGMLGSDHMRESARTRRNRLSVIAQRCVALGRNSIPAAVEVKARAA